MNYLAVFIGGGLGSLSRYGISLFVMKNKFTNFPLATLISNLLACVILAFCVYIFKEKLNQTSWLAPLLVTGFCGGFSTFSTFSLETIELMQQGNLLWAAMNIVLSILLGIGVFWFLSLK